MPTVAQQDQPLPGSLEEAQQRYETTKKALKAGISKKRQIDRALTDLESQIFLFEGSYLASTSTSGGNIVKGFDGYLKSTASSSHGPKSAPANVFSANDVPVDDRMFSASSATYTRSLQLKANEGRSREQSPATPGGSGNTSTPSKKDKHANGGDKGSEKSGGGKEKISSKKDKAVKEEAGDTSMDRKATPNGADATPTPGKSKKRDKDKDASVNGSHKKKRKDDD